MSPAYLVDTDWTIHYLNGAPVVVGRLRELRPHGLALSIVSLAELYEGVYFSTDPQGNESHLANFLSGLTVLGLDDEICKTFGRERGKLRQQRKLVGDLDLLIASTCLRYNLTLLTNNRRHFEQVEGLELMSV